MAEFENPTFDPEGPRVHDDYSFYLFDPPLDVQQQLDASGERIQSMRGEIRQGELEDQKRRLFDTFYNEVNRAYGFCLECRIDYEQFRIDDDGKKTLLALSSLATKYGVGGTVAVRMSLGLTGYTSKTSRLSSAA